MHASKEYGFHIQHGPSQKDCTHTGPAHTPLAMKGYGAVSLDGIATWAHSSLLWCNCNLIQVTRLDPTGPADTGTIWRIILAFPSDFVNHGLQQLASAICSEHSCDYLRRYYIFFSVPRISKLNRQAYMQISSKIQELFVFIHSQSSHPLSKWRLFALIEFVKFSHMVCRLDHLHERKVKSVKYVLRKPSPQIP